jgi:hypothetical protein
VKVWLVHDYPKHPPLCYVAPTRDMEISVSPFVDHSGNIYVLVQSMKNGMIIICGFD